MDIYEIIEEYLSGGRRGTIATIVKKLGAAPREEGAKMFIGEDGCIFGTIGGGCVEAEIWQEARKVGKTEKVKTVHYRMDGKIVENEGMICGGNVTVFLEPVYDRYRLLYRQIRECENNGRGGLIITRFKDDLFFKSLMLEDSSILGDHCEGEDIRDYGSHLNVRKPLLGEGLLLEPLVSSPSLYLFGAGHISQFVSQIANMVGFNVVVVDDRADFANKERFPEAEEVVVEDFSKVFERLTFRGKEYVAILTRGHKHDALVLEEVLKHPTRYVGMIGSKRKTKLIMDHLKQKGFNETLLKSIYAPIGINIDAETPQEIAVSIVAELIKRKRMISS